MLNDILVYHDIKYYIKYHIIRMSWTPMGILNLHTLGLVISTAANHPFSPMAATSEDRIALLKVLGRHMARSKYGCGVVDGIQYV